MKDYAKKIYVSENNFRKLHFNSFKKSQVMKKVRASLKIKIMTFTVVNKKTPGGGGARRINRGISLKKIKASVIITTS